MAVEDEALGEASKCCIYADSGSVSVTRAQKVVPHINPSPWTCLHETTNNKIRRILIGDCIQVYYISDPSEQQTVLLTTVCWWQKLGTDWQ